MPLHLEPGDGPPSFVDLIATAGYRAMAAALRLGVFAALSPTPLTAPQLATTLNTDPRGTALLAEALVAFGYLEREGDTYSNTAPTEKWLSGNGYSEVDRFWSTVLFESWDGLEDSIRTGKPALDFYGWLSERPETLERFQRMLSSHADSIAPEVTTHVPTGTSLLDIGGGHAKYAIRLCKANPALHATVIDLPEALAVGEEAVTAAALTDRITLRPGDYDDLDLGTDHDTILLFNVVHGRPAEANRTLLTRAAAALRPGGSVVLLEHDEHSEDRAGDAFARVFSLNLFHGQGGQVYPTTEIEDWLHTVGLTTITTHPLSTSPGQSLITATKPT
ncbi:class I SAM-dependent methyltransferase [Saccharothrix sp. NPDC042600]|uniref:class I SAM-dependent methyltransferase n=1 Tax=Saccharothrix TaxID=2071 RepID=UPI00340282B0